MHPLLFHFGKIAIPAYGVLTAAGLLAALALLVLQARRLRLRPDKVWNLGLTAILAALFGERLLLIATHFAIFRAHPFWILGLATVPGTWIAVGGAAIGIAAAALYGLAEGLPLLRTADAAAPALALAFAINRIGAFCAGMDWGTPTRLPWGVTYRSVVAYLWYQTPLGVTLQPVQLYDAAASLAIFALLLAMPHRRDGETAGVWLFLYGVSRFFLEFWRGNAQHVLGGALTVAQVLAVAAVLAGGALWLRRHPRPVAVSA
ncbi:MAG TPA: prolipoprotein diacylglyceryl transferase family protein [Acidobacteriaceae bacterium]|nr:prolipoprotein diacylglyceryl transferase family protein [Acidobacteriaceae bacterium]